MKVVVAGFSRTGTMSMQVALQKFGYRTYHMFEALRNMETGHLDMWNNYMEGNGMIIYNSFEEVIEKKARLSISLPVSEKGSLLYLGGKWSANRSYFSAADPFDSGPESIISYNALSIFGGLSWKF